MKRLFVGALSVLLLLGSILGASSRRPRPARPGRDGGPAMWV
jgi:hypothetical protein